ncbi:hypothetical protein [Streptomyces sp. AM 2-1-1]|uniref:hypothetical protein n=1 Tax=Streptomyces sp. AM 2-1-1 TaxID=3028709 RepID=UPI0023B8E4B6|nr:hypothetical protein [Streptomyces sp. AM 2-1-1]WEH38783.1 hypothetical protein PZB77_04245 [Streptomyces sp. AM 2-1-1]
MSADRPLRTSTPAFRGPRGRVARVAALTAGATLGLGVLSMPLAAASGEAGTSTGAVALAADEVSAPAVVLGSTSVKAGGEVTFTATGFPAASKVSVKLDDATLLAQFTSGADGSVSGTVTVPGSTAPGTDHWLRFLATGTSVKSAALTVTATPAVTLGTTSVKAGGEVTFTATGFPAASKVSVKLDDATLLAQFTSGADGSVSGTVTVPGSTAPGTDHWLRFLATGTSVKSAALTVTATTPTPEPATPKIRLGATKVAAGGTVSFDLSGFVTGQTITVKLDDQTILKQWTAAVKADGTFSGTVTVPATAGAGAHWLRILAPDPSTSLKADFTVTSSPSTGGSSNGGSTGGSTGGSGSTGGGSTGGSSTGGAGTGGSPTGGGSTGGSGTGGTSTGGTSTGGSSTPSGTSATITAGSNVAAGGKVSFRLTGFPAGQQITVKLDDGEIIGQWPDGIASDGSFSGTVTVPATATKGAHWLRFLAPNPSTSMKADFTVTTGAAASATTGGTGGTGTSAAGANGSTAAGGAVAAIPAATGAPASASNASGAKAEITASEVQPGGKLHFKVTDFPASQVVTIKLDDDAILGQWDIDAQGSFEGDVEIPAEVTPGAHWLRFLAPNPATTLKVDFTALAADPTAAAAVAAPSPDAAATTTDPTVNAASVQDVGTGVSYATIAWAAGAAAVGGAVGAAGATTFVLRRRKPDAPRTPSTSQPAAV